VINLQTIPADGTSTSGADETIEAYLDVEVAGAIAKGAKIVYVYEQDAFKAAAYAINNRLGEVLSMSFGGCEADNAAYANSIFEPLLKQASAHGMTFIASSGDTGPRSADKRRLVPAELRWGVGAACKHGRRE
jgi:subtilase family serine protease